jgi:AraC-like DNA-binding protein
MENYVYETHEWEDSLLPFIFHREFSVIHHHCPPNWHENIELLYCLSGQGQLQCGTENITFLPGDLYVVNPDLPHCVYSDSAVLYRCLIIDNSFLQDNGITPPVHFQHLIRDDRFHKLFEQLKDAYDQYAQKKAYAVLDIRHTVLHLLQILCAEFVIEAPGQTDSAANSIVKKALLYIRKNMTKTITLDGIADYVGINKYHLSRSFKTITGKTIIEMVNLIRCTEAKRYIENGMSVSSAANSCGYENLSYFSRTFQKIFSKQPSAFSPEKNHTAN